MLYVKPSQLFFFCFMQMAHSGVAKACIEHRLIMTFLSISILLFHCTFTALLTVRPQRRLGLPSPIFPIFQFEIFNQSLVYEFVNLMSLIFQKRS